MMIMPNVKRGTLPTSKIFLVNLDAGTFRMKTYNVAGKSGNTLGTVFPSRVFVTPFKTV